MLITKGKATNSTKMMLDAVNTEFHYEQEASHNGKLKRTGSNKMRFSWKNIAKETLAKHDYSAEGRSWEKK